MGWLMFRLLQGGGAAVARGIFQTVMWKKFRTSEHAPARVLLASASAIALLLNTVSNRSKRLFIFKKVAFDAASATGHNVDYCILACLAKDARLSVSPTFF